MKTASVLFLIFIAFSSARVIDRITELEPQCENLEPFTLTKDDLENYPEQDFYGLTVAFFTHWFGDECEKTTQEGDQTLLEISIGEKKLLELINTDNVYQVLYVFDKDNVAIPVMNVPRMADDYEERVAISVDLKNGVVSAGMMSVLLEDLYKTASKDSINFGTLAFDDSVEIIFNEEYHAGNLLFEYNSNLATSLYQYMFVPESPQDITLYEMKEGSGYLVTANNENNEDDIYFGANTVDTTDDSDTTNPSWAADGIEFTKDTQYLFKPLEEAFYGSTADYHKWVRSASFSLWINPTEQLTTEQPIIRSLRDPEWVTDAISVKIDGKGKVVVHVAGNLFGTSNDALPLNQWTLLTVNIGGFQDFFGYANIYFGATLQNEKFNLVKLAPAPNTKRRLALADEESGVVFGGFVGKLSSIGIMGPGYFELKPSTTPGCMADFGFESSVCLVEQCPNGFTTFPCVEQEEVKKDDDDGLSGGAIAGIVIGSVAFALLVAGVAYFVISRKMRESKKDNRKYKVPETPTESASIKKTTEA